MRTYMLCYITVFLALIMNFQCELRPEVRGLCQYGWGACAEPANPIAKRIWLFFFFRGLLFTYTYINIFTYIYTHTFKFIYIYIIFFISIGGCLKWWILGHVINRYIKYSRLSRSTCIIIKNYTSNVGWM